MFRQPRFNRFVALLDMSLMCWLKLNLLSIVTPKYLSCCVSFMRIKAVVGTNMPNCFSAKRCHYERNIVR